MKWKIAASPISGQFSERQSNTATAIASGTLTTATRLAFEHNAESRAYPGCQEPRPTRENLNLSGTNRIAQIGLQSRIVRSSIIAAGAKRVKCSQAPASAFSQHGFDRAQDRDRGRER